MAFPGRGATSFALALSLAFACGVFSCLGVISLAQFSRSSLDETLLGRVAAQEVQDSAASQAAQPTEVAQAAQATEAAQAVQQVTSSTATQEAAQTPGRYKRHARRAQENVDGVAREAAIERLVAAVRKNVKPALVKRCERVIRGEEGSMKYGWSGQGQDWAVFQNFFVHIPYGEGTYLDLAANDPDLRSNTAFFDRCLGWKGICVEPNPKYLRFYQEGSPQRTRTCRHVKSCVSNHAKSLWMNFKADGSANAVQGKGANRVQVPCQSLVRILEESNITGPGQLDYVSLDIEGSEMSAVFCFPFVKYKIPVWLVETTHNQLQLMHHFVRNGYAHVANLLGWGRPTMKCNFGEFEDSVFMLMDPPIALGPQFLPGRPHFRKHVRGQCKPNAKAADCPDQLTVILKSETSKLTKRGFAFGMGQCGPVLKNITGSAAEEPPFDIFSAEEPTQCLKNGGVWASPLKPLKLDL